LLIVTANIAFYWGRRASSDGGGRRLGDRDDLFDRTGAGSDRADDLVVDLHRQATAEDHDVAAIALLDPEQRRSGLGKLGEMICRLVEHARRLRLADGKFDASRESAVLAGEGDEVATAIL
jgi:hypothetical protein